jgi:hypothetical protein
MSNEEQVATWSPGPRGPARIYKNRPKGFRKGDLSCLACFPQNRPGQPVPLRYGVTLVLCASHRDPRFVAASSGRRFLAAIGALFHSLGLTAPHYHEALRAFVADMTDGRRAVGERCKPGSYAWPGRRQAAEAVWSHGGSFEEGLAAALAEPPDPDRRNRPPTSRTVRRWWQDRRWLLPPAPVPIVL